MVIEQVLLHQLRHFHYCHFTLKPDTNLIVGRNGSGKTSLLEALYYLAYAKSFRSNNTTALIAHGQNRLQIDARIRHDDQVNTIQTSFGTQKNDRTLKLNQLPGFKQSQLAKLLPTVFIDTSTHREFAHAPKNRRDYLNWCCFYLFPNYHDDLSKFQRTLQQRNQLLKQYKINKHSNLSQLDSWTEPLVFYAEKIHQSRLQAITQINQKMAAIWPYFFTEPPAYLDYEYGWKHQLSYADSLAQSRTQDLIYGYTQHGPHRADLNCTTHDHHPLFHTYSQGQQKLFSYLLRFIQLDLVSVEHSCHRVLLIDDLPAELDTTNQEKIIDFLNDVHCQKFVTALTPDVFNNRFCQHAIFVDSKHVPRSTSTPTAFAAHQIMTEETA